MEIHIEQIPDFLNKGVVLLGSGIERYDAQIRKMISKSTSPLPNLLTKAWSWPKASFLCKKTLMHSMKKGEYFLSAKNLQPVYVAHTIFTPSTSQKKRRVQA